MYGIMSTKSRWLVVRIIICSIFKGRAGWLGKSKAITEQRRQISTTSHTKPPRLGVFSGSLALLACRLKNRSGGEGRELVESRASRATAAGQDGFWIVSEIDGLVKMREMKSPLP